MSVHGRINWDKVRTEYITGVDNKGRKHSLRSLAKQFGISIAGVEQRSKKEGWVKLREDYLDRIQRTIEKRKEDLLINQALRFDEEIFKATLAILSILNSRLIVIKVDGTAEPNHKLPTMEIQRIANILQMIQPVREKAIGDAGGADESSLTDLNRMLEDAQNEFDGENPAGEFDG